MVSSQPHAAASLESRLSEPEHEGRAVCPQSSPHTPRGLAEPSGRSRATAPLLPASSHHLRRATPQAFAQTRGAGNSGGVASGPWPPPSGGLPASTSLRLVPRSGAQPVRSRPVSTVSCPHLRASCPSGPQIQAHTENSVHCSGPGVCSLLVHASALCLPVRLRAPGRHRGRLRLLRPPTHRGGVLSV